MTVIVFSKDRPLQLDAALRSWSRHCRDGGNAALKVLFKASNSRMLSLFRHVMREHPEAAFFSERDFRRDLQVLLPGRGCVGFVVDDSIFVRDFSVADITSALDQNPEAIGYSMRLGRNTTYCYSLNRAQDLPAFESAGRGALKFRWPEASCDFGYPLELSSSVYRVEQILPLLKEIAFKNPNTLEEALWQNAARFRESHPLLLCPETSLAFAAPVNRVQQEVQSNRAGSDPQFSADALAAAFMRGERIDTGALDGFTPRGCHEEVEFKISAGAPAVPLISVIIPCYNQAHYLAEAVDSVVGQTFADWEIIIVDDGSPDNTAETARQLMACHGGRRIRLLQQRNSGLACARNTGIAAAAGAYILPLDADDKIAPAMLEKTAAVLEAEPDVAIVYTDVAHFGAVEKTIQAAEFDFQKLRIGNQLNYCSLYRWEVWQQAGGYNPNMVWGYEDWDFWITCAERGLRAKRLPGALLLYRVKEASMYTAALANDAALRARIILNHPTLYSAISVQAAAAIWSRPAMSSPPGAPKVSVILPTFNRPDRLEEALRSIGGQTLRDFEIIVVNDNGIDVANVTDRCQIEAATVYIRHHMNKGLAAARNTGLRRARGRYIAYLDDDDVFLPEHLRTLADFLDSSRNKMAYTDAWCAQEELVDGQYKVVQREALYSADWDNDRILVHNFVPVLCFLHDRCSAIAAGGFDEQMTTHEDWDFWIRLSRICTPVHIKKITCEFRARTDGSSMTSGRRADFLRTARMVYEKYRALTAGNETIHEKQQALLRALEVELGIPPKPTFGTWMTAQRRQAQPAGQYDGLQKPPGLARPATTPLASIGGGAAAAGPAKAATPSSRPTISVLIPTYNYARYLPEAIESVLAQDFQDFELLVVDDCSPDNTAEVVKPYCLRDPRVQFIAHPKNIGMVNNWNYCLERARGEYIKFVFGDDKLCHNQALSRLSAMLRAEPSATLASSARILIDQTSKVLEVQQTFPEGRHDGRKVMMESLKGGGRNLVGEPSVVMFRKADAQRGFDPKYRQIVDVEMWFHLLEKGALAYTRKPLCAFRKHGTQQTNVNQHSGLALKEHRLFFDNYTAQPWIPRRTCFDVLFELRRRRRKEPESLYAESTDTEKRLARRLGAWYWIFWTGYRVTCPFSNLKRSIKKRLPGARKMKRQTLQLGVGLK